MFVSWCAELCFLSSHHEAILRSQFVVRDLRLSRQVGRSVVVGGDKLSVLIFMELIRSRLQHTLLQLNTPLELYIPECTERHQQAEQPLLKKESKKCFIGGMFQQPHWTGSNTWRMTVFLSDGGCSPRIRATSSSFWALWSLESVWAVNEPSSSWTPNTARASPALAI